MPSCCLAFVAKHQVIDRRRNRTELAQQHCDLAAMIGPVVDKVHKAFPERIAPGFALEVLIGQR